MNKKILACALALALISPGIVNTLAETHETEIAYENKAVNEPTVDELEAVIKAVKPLFDIPSEYSDFTWDYYGGNEYSDAYWTLRWSTPRDITPYGHASVFCDAFGRIKSFNIYSDDVKQSFPEYTKAELIDTAKEFVLKTAPDANFVFDKANDAYGRFAREYTYSFKRIENGIEYPENSATVSINFTTGKVTSCNYRYDYDIPVSDCENIITKEEAAEILGTEQKMELSYSYLREKKEDGTYANRAVLVYSPLKSYVSVDAKTGEIYFEKTEMKGPTFGTTVGDKNMSLEGAESESDGGYVLTEEELAQLEVLNGLITKEEAVKRITGNKSLYLDLSLTAISGELSKSYNTAYDKTDEKYIWHIYFSAPTGGEKYNSAYANATIDAKTGEIIGFNSSLRNSYYYQQNEITPPEVKYTEEECEKIFSDFVKSNIPAKFEKTEKEDVYQTNAIKYLENEVDGVIQTVPVFGAYGFNYVRTNDGLKFTPNRIRGVIDGVTGKISSYGYSWTENIVFESVSDAMSADKAYEIYLTLSDFDKYYERYDEFNFKSSDNSTPEEKFRAFVLAIKQYTEKYEEIVNTYAPDIDTDLLKKAILADDEDTIVELAAEYFGVNIPDSFYFYDSIENLYDKTSTARLVYKSKNPSVRISALSGEKVNYSGKVIEDEFDGEYADIDGHWAQRYIVIMADLGVLVRAENFCPDEYIGKEDFQNIMSAAGMNFDSVLDSDAEITRLSAVKHIVNSLGYGKIAAIEGIYKTEFADNPEISQKDIGYLAIAYGLDIIEGDAGTGTFRPNARITKAEAVKLAVEAIKAAQ